MRTQTSKHQTPMDSMNLRQYELEFEPNGLCESVNFGQYMNF